ncbi:MAG: 2,3-bisphosphoglycerate-independent phosphoglycerate mutase [Clostridiales bacterium]|nr:2,3-bisphosphoglycerate-independent phosphoglycerate mutase [Clostridiales bacterium]
MKHRPVFLLILDGYGLGAADDTNAIYLAKTPNIDALSRWGHTVLSASGPDVGLPQGQMGNSEVGHTNLGAGRVMFQDLPHITNAIENGSFFENPAYCAAADAAAAGGHALHILGLLSDGGVHSHIRHIFAMLELAKRRGVERVYLHCFLDGRDVPPESGAGYLRQLQAYCSEHGVGTIATVQGRFYGMDRDKRWDRVERGYNALVLGEGTACSDPAAAVEASCARGVTDEFVEPLVCCPEGRIRQGDSVVFMNFRPDRAREMTWALNLPEFDGFVRRETVYPLHYVCTAQYDETLTLPVAFPPEHPAETLGEFVSQQGLRQFRIAETEKYAHVTYFFNGGVEPPFPGEDRVLVPSTREYPTYDLIPRMSVYEVAEQAAARIVSGEYDLGIVNFANCDMVGHTGVRSAAVEAVQHVDACVGTIVRAVERAGGMLLVTADHGNADCMVNPDGTPNTAHTTNLVPLWLVGCRGTLHPGSLCDVAPTILTLMGLPQPKEMTGVCLLDGVRA